ncbi:MAG: hypothetical protein GC191_08155 [Azospirillum sp.]|nr:hypothetical protein [Azospirillum sp.]
MITIVVSGALDQDAIAAAVEAEAGKAVAMAAAAAAGQLRAVTAAAGLGPLARAWRTTRPAAIGEIISARVFADPRWAKALAAFAHGATILPGPGHRWLAIPTPAVPADGRGGRLSPPAFERRLGRHLRFIPARDRRTAYLVLDGSTRQAAGQLLFVLAPQVTLTKRYDLDRILADTAATFPDLTVSTLD